MIVTFDVSDGASINGASNPDAKYMNFLRCVTAACTAAAGTTSLTGNPWTSTTALDTSKKCIVSIDANTIATTTFLTLSMCLYESHVSILVEFLQRC